VILQVVVTLVAIAGCDSGPEYRSTMTIDRASGVVADGSDAARVSIHVERDGKPFSGQRVVLSVSGSGNLVESTHTDAGGSAVVAVRATVVGERVIGATLVSSDGSAFTLPYAVATSFTADVAGVRAAHQTYAASGPRGVAAGDWSGDGIPDLAFGTSAGVLLLRGRPDGLFAPVAALAGAPQGAGALALGALDGDLLLDLAVASPASATVTVLSGDGAGGFTLPRTVTLPGVPAEVAVADMNGDGRADLVVSSPGAGLVTVALADASFALAPSIDLAAGGPAFAVALLDGDARPDIVVANLASGTASVFLADASGGFFAPSTLAVGGSPASIAAGDVDGDGVADLVVGDLSGPAIAVFLGDGAGGFTRRPDLLAPAGAAIARVAAGDLDRDGRADVAAAISGPEPALLLFGGDGAGGFAAPEAFPLAGAPAALALVPGAAGVAPKAAVALDAAGEAVVVVPVGSRLTVTPTSLPSDGVSAASISIALRDGNGNPIAGAVVTVTATGAGNLIAAAPASDAAGLSATTLRATVGGARTLTAVVDPQGAAIALPLAPRVRFGPGPAARLAFGVEPSGARAGEAIAPTVTVLALDASGAVDTAFSGTIDVALEPGSPASTLGGTTSVSAIAGLASFSDLSLALAASGYALRATSGALAATTSAAFAITPADASALFFTSQPPAAVTAGATIAPVVDVTARDAFGNVATGFAGAVSITLSAGPAAALSGATSVTAAAGVASFSGLSLALAAGGYALQASSGPLAATSSAAFAVSPAEASALFFTTQPSDAPTGLPITPAVAVTARDAFGNVATAFSGTVSITLSAGPAATLSGATSVSATAGTAAFPGLSLDTDGAGYRLRADAAPLASTTSAAFRATSGLLARAEISFATDVAGGTGDVTVVIETRAVLPGDAHIVLVLATDYDTSAASVVSVTGLEGAPTLSLFRTLFGFLRIRISGGAPTPAGRTITATFAGVKNPPLSGTRGGFDVRTENSGTVPIETGTTNAVTLTPGAIDVLTFLLFHDAPGVRTRLRLGYIHANAVPPSVGQIIVGFPPGFDLSGATASELIPVFGAMPLTVSGSSLILSPVPGALPSSRDFIFDLVGVRTPLVTGPTAAFTITHQYSSGIVIDTGTHTGVTIAEGTIAAAASFVTGAGARGDLTLALTPQDPWPSDGALSVTLPAELDAGTADALATSSVGGGTFAVTGGPGSLTITRSGGADIVDVSVTLIVRGISDPTLSGLAGAAGVFAVETRTSGGVRIDAGTGALARSARDELRVDARPGSLAAEAASPMTVTITTTHGWPADGVLELDFPVGVSTGSIVAVEARDGLGGGGFAPLSLAGRTLTVARDGTGAAVPTAAAFTIVVEQPRNGPLEGVPFGTVTARTLEADGTTPIDAGLGAPPGLVFRRFAPLLITASGAEAIAVIDFDHAGLPDLASTSGSLVTVLVNRTAPGGPLAFDPPLQGDGAYIDLAAEDLDGDGFQDLVAVFNGPGGNKFQLYPNQGGSLGAAQRFETGQFYSPLATAIADVDLDGRQDLVAVVHSPVDGLWIERNTTLPGETVDASTTFARTEVEGAPGADSALSVAVGDLDGDGLVDVVVGRATSGHVDVFQNTSTFGNPAMSVAAVPVPGAGIVDIRGVRIADVDGDGKLDIVAADTGDDDRVIVLRNIHAPGQPLDASAFDVPIAVPVAAVWFQAGAIASPVEVADMDGDHRKDLLAAGNGSLRVLFNRAVAGVSLTAADFEAREEYALPHEARDAVVADLSGDGRPDVFFAFSPGQLGGLQNVLAPIGASLTAADFLAPQAFDTGLGLVNGIATADLDGDGRPDFVATGASGLGTGVARNGTAAGSHVVSLTAEVIPGVGSAVDVRAVRLARSPRTDILLADVLSGALVALENVFAPPATLGAASFTSSSVTALALPRSAAAGDLRASGAGDVVVAGAGLRLLQNDHAPGTPLDAASDLVDAGALDAAATFHLARIADVDGDGRADIVAAVVGGGPFVETLGAGETFLAFYRNGGAPGAPLATTDFSLTYLSTGRIGGHAIDDMDIVDLDGDGRLDVIATVNGAGVEAFHNRSTPGNVTFTASGIVVAGANATYVAAGDVNGDGRPDIAYADADQSLKLFLNGGAPGAIAIGDFSRWFTVSNQLAGPRGVAIADVNGDGRPDLVTTTGGDDLAVILRR